MGKTKNKKVGIYSPYIDMFGGGERYILDLAQYLSKDNEVYLFRSDGNNIKERAKEKFNLNLERVHFILNTFIRKQNIFNIIKTLYSFDIFFYMTDGSLFLSPARKNYCIIQSPMHCPENNFKNQLKLLRWNILCYSNFMADIIKNRLGKAATVLSPPISTINAPNIPKEDLILTVGRFFTRPHNKKQDILVTEFIDGIETVYKGCQFVLAGGLTEEGGKEYLQNLQEKSSNFPIKFYINPSYEELMSLYAKAKIYWHATGFGEDLEENPEKAEHFGITTIEAMSHGAVPIVFNAGGQKEIVKEDVDGFLWSYKSQLREKTNILLTNKEKWNLMSQKAKEKAKIYSNQSFYEKLETLLSK